MAVLGEPGQRAQPQAKNKGGDMGRWREERGHAGEELGCGQRGQRDTRWAGAEGQWDSVGDGDSGTRGLRRQNSLQTQAEKGWGLEMAERGEELGFWHVRGVLGKEIKTGLQN